MANFDKYYPTLEHHEGGYASAEAAAKIKDTGGETYKGIARNYNPSWAGWKIIDEYKRVHGTPKWNSTIPIDELNKMVKQYAKSAYWDTLKLDSVKNQSIAQFIYDFGFNSGRATPVLIVQRLLKLPVDGKMGMQTISQINKAPQQNLFDTLKAARIKFLTDSKKIKASIKPQLIERADSFFFHEAETEQLP